MENSIREKVSSIIDGKLSANESEELIQLMQYALSDNTNHDDEFFKNLVYEMSGSVKELALMIIDFKKHMQSKIQPEIMDIATKYIPHTADQLESIIETTEMAANKIMDNLDLMQVHTEKMETVFTMLKKGKVKLPENGGKAIEIDGQVVDTLDPLITYAESTTQDYSSLISDTFVQMSFQDLTGQRIKRIMNLVSQMENRIKRMIVCFGIKLYEKEKNPNISEIELQKAIAEKEIELAGPQKAGHGLDQEGIDQLLANL